MIRKILLVISLIVLGVLGGYLILSKKPTQILTLPTFQTNIYAQDLPEVRVLTFSPGGTLIASLTSQGKIVAVNKGTILEGLNNPHGIAFYNNKLYVAEETEVTRYNWDEENTKASLDKVLFSLPKGGRHFTRSLVFGKDGKMYISIGSSCDVCIEPDERLASVLVSDSEGSSPKVFATGLRNSVFIIINPKTNELWGTEMGRDFLGDNLPPDEINIIQEGKNYGWPYCYGNKVRDKTFEPNVLDQVCQNTEPPIFELPAHVAPLGLVFVNSLQFPEDWQGDLLVAYHGSWNSIVPVGYKIVHLKVEGNNITQAEDFLINYSRGVSSRERPVDLVFDKDGNLYLSDDSQGIIYKISKG